MTSVSKTPLVVEQLVSCRGIFRKNAFSSGDRANDTSSVDGTPSCETDDDETGSPCEDKRLGSGFSSYAPADCCISTSELARNGLYPFC